MTYIVKPYDQALQRILDEGVHKENRTGVDTIAVFGIQSRYRIDEYFPILTGRKVWPRAIFAELLWFLSGSTQNKDLQDIGSNIWTPWVDAEFEEKHSFEEGELGPVYGFQLRHFGADYKTVTRLQREIQKTQKRLDEESKRDDEFLDSSSWDHHCVLPSSSIRTRLSNLKKQLLSSVGGFDQMEYMLTRIREKPDCRRILFSLWNPAQLKEQRLPPCHFAFQIFIHEDKMSGMLTQRSCDFPVGVPANIQFYSALIYMLAQQTGYTPYEFIHSTADSHIYVNQIDAVKEYLDREKPDSPKLNLKKASDIYSYSMDDFDVIDYNPLDKISIPVAV